MLHWWQVTGGRGLLGDDWRITGVTSVAGVTGVKGVTDVTDATVTGWQGYIRVGQGCRDDGK